jgi:hypothetical protein
MTIESSNRLADLAVRIRVAAKASAAGSIQV